MSRHADSNSIQSLPRLCQRLIDLSNEIESFCQLDSLDIEFAVDIDDNLFTLQIRPLLQHDKNLADITDTEIFNSLNSIHEFIEHNELKK